MEAEPTPQVVAEPKPKRIRPPKRPRSEKVDCVPIATAADKFPPIPCVDSIGATLFAETATLSGPHIYMMDGAVTELHLSNNVIGIIADGIGHIDLVTLQSGATLFGPPGLKIDDIKIL